MLQQLVPHPAFAVVQAPLSQWERGWGRGSVKWLTVPRASNTLQAVRGLHPISQRSPTGSAKHVASRNGGLYPDVP
jgi:hypothetical protein